MKRYLKVLVLAMGVAAVGIGCDLHSIINPIRGDWQATGENSTYAYEETISFKARGVFEVTGSLRDSGSGAVYTYSGEGTYETSDGNLLITAYLDVNETPSIGDIYSFAGTYETGTTSYDNDFYLYLTDPAGTEFSYVRQ